jgi:hypothetical protein
MRMIGKMIKLILVAGIFGGFLFGAAKAVSDSNIPMIQPVAVEYRCPAKPQKTFGIPIIKSSIEGDSEIISLYNDVVKVVVAVDKTEHAFTRNMKTEDGSEILSKPFHCFDVIDCNGKVLVNGADFKLKEWHSRIHGNYAELELRLAAPEPVVWRLRLYQDRPYLEQRFEMPEGWRQPGNAVRQKIVTVESLTPVMPNPITKLGFTEGKPNLKGRHRFEYTPVSEHLVYDEKTRTGLSGFAAGIAGQERFEQKSFVLLDKVTAVFGAQEPPARFILCPFNGPAETGFGRVRRFINDDYACQKEYSNRLSWTQYFDWQIYFKTPVQQQKDRVDPYYREAVSAERIMKILPSVAEMGFEDFWLDAGWEEGYGNFQWRFDPQRFQNGFEPVRKMVRELGMRQRLWWGMSEITDNYEIMLPVIEQSDVMFFFLDRLTDEKTIASIRKLREKYPDFEFMNHFARGQSEYWKDLNLHYCSDLSMSYFLEGEFFAWTNVADKLKRVSVTDLVARSLAYQANWIWPYKSVYECMWPWVGYLDRPISQLKSRANCMLAARYYNGDGFDPADLSPEQREFWLDFAAFYKAIRYYLQDYQQILPVPDGVNPDGIAHLRGGKGFIFLFNPGSKEAEVTYKQLLWDPTIELDPKMPVEVSDWSDYVKPKVVASVNVAKPEGGITITSESFRVLGVNIDVNETLLQIKKYRMKH